MKKVKIFIVCLSIFAMPMGGLFNSSYAQTLAGEENTDPKPGCTVCKPGSSECHRIIMPDGVVHIFYGKPEAC